MENSMQRNFLPSLILLLAVYVSPAQSQSNAEANTALRVDPFIAGTRSLGMGGAFIAFSDDAAAAFFNPAGLTSIDLPELTLEYRFIDVRDVSYAERATVEQENRFLQVHSDEAADLSSSTWGSSSVAAVYPSQRPDSRWSMAALWRNSPEIDTAFARQGITSGSERLALPSLNRISLSTRSFGAAFAYRFIDNISIGLTIEHQEISFDSVTRHYKELPPQPAYPFPRPAIAFTWRASTAQEITERDFVDQQIQTARDSDVTITAGIIWEPTDVVRLGLSYSEGPQFDLNTTRNSGPEADTPIPTFPSSGEFRLPTILAGGLGYRFDSAQIGVSIVRIFYSDLRKSLFDAYGQPERHVALSDFRLDDIVRLHVGVEQDIKPNYFPSLRSVRFGLWRDPDHRLRYVGEDLETQALFAADFEEIYHVTLGAGFSFGNHQADVATDLPLGFGRLEGLTLSFSVRLRFELGGEAGSLRSSSPSVGS